MHCTDVVFIDRTSMEVYASFNYKSIIVVSTNKQLHLPFCTYSTVHLIFTHIKSFELRFPLLKSTMLWKIVHHVKSPQKFHPSCFQLNSTTLNVNFQNPPLLNEYL